MRFPPLVRTLALTNRAVRARNCTYTFSPETGLIHRHAVDSIEPAPHESFYEAIRGLRLGLGGTSANTHGRAAACPIPIDDGRSGAKG